MFRRLIIATVLSLPLTGLAGSHGYIGAAHASTFNPTQGQLDPNGSCSTNYPWYPYSLSDCLDRFPGSASDSAGQGPFNDPSGEGIHWTGTSGSYARFLCEVPSIVTGSLYFTYSSAEIDVSDGASGFIDIQETCTVQTPDRPGANLFAYFADGTICFDESLTGDPFAGDADNVFYATETPGGLATLHCTFSSPVI